MKIQLDTNNKTILIEEDVNLHELYETLNSILPDGKWREFTLKMTKIREWKDPIIINPNPYSPQPNTPSPYPPNYPQIWYTNTSSNSNTDLNNGIYNIRTNF